MWTIYLCTSSFNKNSSSLLNIVIQLTDAFTSRRNKAFIQLET